MAATKQGVWDLQQVRDKQLLGEWEYETSDYGAMYGMGENFQGGLGQNTSGTSGTSSPIQLSAGPSPWKVIGGVGPAGRYGIKLDGTFWVWGYADNGKLGLNSPNTGASYGGRRSSPTQLPGTDWAMTYTVESTAMAVKTDGSMWMWGNNYNGEMGLNTGPSGQTQYSSPTQLPGTWSTEERKGHTQDYSAAIKPDGTLWMWGNNTAGVLGFNQPSNARKSSPTQLGSGTDWKYVAGNTGGTSQCFGIKTDGTAWGWGENGAGELAQNNTTPYSSPIQIPGTWTYIQSGDDNVKGIKGDGTLWSWGSNSAGVGGWNGSAGGPSDNSSSPIQIGTGAWADVSSDRQAAMVKADGTMWGVGGNGSGQLGMNNETSRSSPIQIPGITNAWRCSTVEYSCFFTTRT